MLQCKKGSTIRRLALELKQKRSLLSCQGLGAVVFALIYQIFLRSKCHHFWFSTFKMPPFSFFYVQNATIFVFLRSKCHQKSFWKMPILSAYRIGGVRKDYTDSWGASTLEWLLFPIGSIAQLDPTHNLNRLDLRKFGLTDIFLYRRTIAVFFKSPLTLF